MESLRRLRIVWFVLCCIAAAFIALAAYGGAPLSDVATVAVGVALLACASRAATWFSALSFIWIGGVVTLAGLMVSKGNRGDAGELLAVGLGGYILFTVAVWIIRPMLKGGARP